MEKSKHLLLFLLLVMVFLPVAVFAEEALTFERDSQLDLFDENGVKVYLTGEIVDDGRLWLELDAVIDNQTDSTLQISYYGNCNGWNISNSVMSGGNVSPNSKGKSYIWLIYDDLDITCFENIESLDLNFVVSDSNTKQELFTKQVLIEFNGTASDESALVKLFYFDECPSLPTPRGIGDLYQASSRKSSMNGKTTEIFYAFSSTSGESKTDFDKYIALLSEQGFSVNQASSNAYTVSTTSGTEIATVYFVARQIQIDIVPND